MQTDTCGSPVIISVILLTCAFLYSRYHPWVSRFPAGLKWDETSSVALTADLETLLHLCSSSLCLQSNVSLMSYLTITSAGIVYIVWTAGGNGFFPPAITAGGQKWTFACDQLYCGRRAGIVCDALDALNILLTNKHISLVGFAARGKPRVLRAGFVFLCRGNKWNSCCGCLDQFSSSSSSLLFLIQQKSILVMLLLFTCFTSTGQW